MVLGQLQTLLNDLYALEIAYDVNDFLITDAQLASQLDEGGRCVDEKLLIAEDADTASVSLYLEKNLMDRLQKKQPGATAGRGKSSGLLEGAGGCQSLYLLRLERTG